MKNEELFNEMLGLLKNLPNQKILSDFKEWYAVNRERADFAATFESEYRTLYESLGGTLWAEESPSNGTKELPPTLNDIYKSSPSPVVRELQNRSYNHAYITEKTATPPETWGNIIATIVLWLGIVGGVVLIIAGIAQYDDWDDEPVNLVFVAMGVGALLSSLVIWAILRMLSAIISTLKSK